jgi:hypothetical protein
MSMAELRWTFDLRGLTPGEKLVLACLAWHADKTHRIATMGIETLEVETGLEECAIARHLKTLEKRRFMSRSRRYDKFGRRLTDAFQLRPNAKEVPGKLPDKVAGKTPVNGREVARHFEEGCPAFCSELPGELQAAYIDEPSTEPRKRTQNYKRQASKNFSAGGDRKKSERKGRSTRTENDRIFDSLFLDSYPKKTSIDAARREFCKVIEEHRATVDQLVDGARRYADYVAAAETPPQFVKAPDRWLRDGNWKDDLRAASNGRQSTIFQAAANLLEKIDEHYDQNQ